MKYTDTVITPRITHIAITPKIMFLLNSGSYSSRKGVFCWILSSNWYKGWINFTCSVKAIKVVSKSWYWMHSHTNLKTCMLKWSRWHGWKLSLTKLQSLEGEDRPSHYKWLPVMLRKVFYWIEVRGIAN